MKGGLVVDLVSFDKDSNTGFCFSGVISQSV